MPVLQPTGEGLDKMSTKKTKKQLVEELGDLRARLVTLEESGAKSKQAEEALARQASELALLHQARTALARTLGIATLAAVMIAVAVRELLAGIWGFTPDTLEIATVLMVVHFLLIFPEYTFPSSALIRMI